MDALSVASLISSLLQVAIVLAYSRRLAGFMAVPTALVLARVVGEVGQAHHVVPTMTHALATIGQVSTNLLWGVIAATMWFNLSKRSEKTNALLSGLRITRGNHVRAAFNRMALSIPSAVTVASLVMYTIWMVHAFIQSDIVTMVIYTLGAALMVGNFFLHRHSVKQKLDDEFTRLTGMSVWRDGSKVGYEPPPSYDQL